jgi:hypothetical protein
MITVALRAKGELALASSSSFLKKMGANKLRSGGTNRT